MTGERASGDWPLHNQRALMHDVACVRAALERYAGHDVTPEIAAETDPVACAPSSALDLVCARFGLSSFERKLIVLCAAPELDGRFGRTLGLAQGDPSRAYPSFGLA